MSEAERKREWLVAMLAVGCIAAFVVGVWYGRHVSTQRVAQATEITTVAPAVPTGIVLSATAFEAHRRLLRAAVVALARHGMLLIDESGNISLPPLEPRAATP